MFRRMLLCAIVAVVVVLGSARQSPAQDLHQHLGELAKYAVVTYHPEIKPDAIEVVSVSVLPAGESFHAFVAVTWEEGRSLWRLTPRTQTAEIRTTVLWAPNRHMAYKLDYTDTVGSHVSHDENTAKVLADYNVVLERTLRFPSIPVAETPPAQPDDAPTGWKAWFSKKLFPFGKSQSSGSAASPGGPDCVPQTCPPPTEGSPGAEKSSATEKAPLPRPTLRRPPNDGVK